MTEIKLSLQIWTGRVIQLAIDKKNGSNKKEVVEHQNYSLVWLTVEMELLMDK